MTLFGNKKKDYSDLLYRRTELLQQTLFQDFAESFQYCVFWIHETRKHNIFTEGNFDFDSFS
jgi:hypothetical protein